MFIQPASVQQVAALPYVSVGDQTLVLLITSRERGRWILPKGWPIKGLSYSEAAAREAEEEAGVIGAVKAEPLGHFDYQKRMAKGYEVRCSVLVYPLQVVEHRLEWRERGDRNFRWCPLSDAPAQVDDAGLSELLNTIHQSLPTVSWTL
ncbi:MAG: NUDIX hydrolase [Alphaproteobacteria bacterium]|nr:NUDIX hydrolase [Alphaproteobacteria bacterium]